MTEYIPSPRDWVREQVELYEGSGGAEGVTLRETGLPVMIVTHIGRKTGAIRKTPLMTVKDGERVCAGGVAGRGAEESGVGLQSARQPGCRNSRWERKVLKTRAREVTDDAERARLWETVCGGVPALRWTIRRRRSVRFPLFVAE